MTRRRAVSLPVLFALLAASSGQASDGIATRLPPVSKNKIDFGRDVHPLLSQRCFRCHQGADARSGVRLDVRAEVLGQTNGRPLATPGKSADSRLIHLVSGLLADEVMPPNKKDRLSAEQVGLLRAWIDQGLAWDDKLLPPPADAAKHWAFQPIRRPKVPDVKDRSWARTPVDAFVAATHQTRGLSPAPEAERRVLLRRVTFDLTGMPPTPEEIRAFVEDKSPDAYDRVVERLLSSAHYGERWGRHWLDVARYADSEGYEDNRLRPFAWRYRDYVVRSFNNDRPFAEFVRQHVAGDELTPYSDENLIATGFLAAARFSGNEEDKTLQRNDVLIDIVNATASSFLGLTLACAQCHSHKFDALTQRDYYRFQGFFVKGQVNNLLLKDPEMWKKYEAAVPGEYRELEGQRRELLQREAKRLLSLKEKVILDRLKKKIDELAKNLPSQPQTLGFYSPATSPTAVSVVPLQATFPLPYLPDELKRTMPYLLVRGDAHRRGPAVDVGWPALFGKAGPEKLEKSPRTALADWLTSRDNPLTARVWANRVWQYHFGRGLVETAGDFGVRGAKPTHPELLDWLACELLDSGGSTRQLHRHIVQSATYRQAAQGTASSKRLDPENRYLWRWTPRRLEAEAVRDAVLSVSGELRRDLGGPGVLVKGTKKGRNDVPEETTTVLRRSLYLEQWRDYLSPFQSLFDGPAALESCARRHVSTVSLQPLFLLNSPFMADRAKAFAARLKEEAGDDVGRQIDLGFQLAIGRTPDADERRLVRGLFKPGDRKEALTELCQVLLNLNEFVYVE